MGKLKPLTDNQKRALALFAERMDGRLRTHLNSCVHCGLCIGYCPHKVLELEKEGV